MVCFSSLRLLFAIVVAVIGLGTSALVSPIAAQDATVYGLGGTDLDAVSPTASGSCDPDYGGTFEFSAAGTSTGAYPGTFQEYGTVQLGAGTGTSSQPMIGFTSTFSIDSPNGQVSGTTWLVPGSSSQNADTGACQPSFFGDTRYTATAWNLRFEATIVTPDGRTCTAVGSSIAQLVLNSSVLNDSFSHTFYNDVSNAIPTCTSGGGEEPPADMPVTKDDCKDGGWEAYGFENQGLCIQSVNVGG